MNPTKSIFLIIFTLILSPFIIFLGKNSLQTEFLTAKYFWVLFFYCLIFFSLTIIIFIISNRSLYFLLFFSYLSFFQFYFFDIQKFIVFFQYGNTGYYVLALIIAICLIVTITSRFNIFRNFVLILLFLNLSISLINLIPAIGSPLQSALKSNNTNNSITKTNLTQTKYPNIFYIVPDGLTSPKILKDYVDIEFQYSVKDFEKKGFSVSKDNYSSYNLTYLSLGALFAMDYPVIQNSLRYKNRSNFYPTIRDYNPKLLTYLKKNNYKFVIVPPAWGGCPKSKEYICIIPTSDNFISNLFQDYAILKMFQHSLIKKIFDKYNKKYNISTSDMADGGKTVLHKMKINPEDWKDGGVFTMVHMMIPHSFREEDCSITSQYIFPSKEGYKSSVYCAFKRIHELSEFIIEQYPNASIIVQSDHGIFLNKNEHKKPFNEISETTIDSRLSSFTAVRGCNSSKAAKLNQVNIVEFIVECLVNGTKDKNFNNKSFFGFYEISPDFGKVYQIRRN